MLEYLSKKKLHVGRIVVYLYHTKLSKKHDVMLQEVSIEASNIVLSYGTLPSRYWADLLRTSWHGKLRTASIDK